MTTPVSGPFPRQIDPTRDLLETADQIQEAKTGALFAQAGKVSDSLKELDPARVTQHLLDPKTNEIASKALAAVAMVLGRIPPSASA